MCSMSVMSFHSYKKPPKVGVIVSPPDIQETEARVIGTVVALESRHRWPYCWGPTTRQRATPEAKGHTQAVLQCVLFSWHQALTTLHFQFH